MRADKMRNLRAAAAAAKPHAEEGVECQQTAVVALAAEATAEEEDEGDVQWKIVRCVVLTLELLPARDLACLAPTCRDIASSAELEHAWRTLQVRGLRRCFRGRKPSESEVEELMAQMDPGHTGQISRAAFCSAMQLWQFTQRLDPDYEEMMLIMWDCLQHYFGEDLHTVEALVSRIGSCLLHGVSPPSRAGYAEMRRRARYCGITTVAGGEELAPVGTWSEFEEPPRLYLVLLWIMDGHDAWYLPKLGRPGVDGPELDPDALPWIVDRGSVAAAGSTPQSPPPPPPPPQHANAAAPAAPPPPPSAPL